MRKGTGSIVACPQQQWLCKSATMLPYKCTACLVAFSFHPLLSVVALAYGLNISLDTLFPCFITPPGWLLRPVAAFSGKVGIFHSRTYWFSAVCRRTASLSDLRLFSPRSLDETECEQTTWTLTAISAITSPQQICKVTLPSLPPVQQYEITTLRK